MYVVKGEQLSVIILDLSGKSDLLIIVLTSFALNLFSETEMSLNWNVFMFKTYMMLISENFLVEILTVKVIIEKVSLDSKFVSSDKLFVSVNVHFKLDAKALS